MPWDAIGWVVWAALAVYTGSLWWTKLRHENGGIRLLAGRCALCFTLLLILSAEPRFLRFHLLWFGPLVYVASMGLGGRAIERRLESAPRRAEQESRRTGEPQAAILEREYANLGYGSGEDNG